MIYVIDCGTEWLEEIKGNIGEFDHPYKTVKINELEGYRFDSPSGIVISGANVMLSEVDLI